MNYAASVSDYFKHPKWGMNCLLGGVCILIPIIGQLVLSGWLITGFWARGNDDNPVTFPRFDFQYFGKYLERGLWPFLVSLVASLVLVPVIMVLMIGPMFLSGAFAHHTAERAPDAFPVLLMVTMFVIYPVILLAFNFLLVPLMLRATITQDFKAAFDFAFLKSFVSLVWQEMLVSFLFLFGVGIVMMIVTVITCYIGLFFAAPVVSFAWYHLLKQLYQLYLARGGQAVPLSPKLNDLPPALPAVPG
jgi:hypothetical protein